MLDDVRRYAREVLRLRGAESTREETFYPAIRSLITELLQAQALPFDVRTSTSERRIGGGTDLPDLALYDGAGEFVVALCEVKLPHNTIAQMAASNEHNDQIGRYLAQGKVVLLCNLRAFGLLTVSPQFKERSPVPPPHRRLEETVELWPAELPAGHEAVIRQEVAEKLAELVEAAVTRHAPIAEPKSLARILARQARKAKDTLPEQFSEAVKALLDDFGKALGISFEGTEGQDFFRSSLVQTIFYGLFAGWALWRHSKSTAQFRWEDLPGYLKIPFLGELIYELQHPRRIKELNLRPHLDIATETFSRVDEVAFFKNFKLPGIRQTGDTSDKAATTSAIVYFYEPFLEAFDPGLRKELGVWYTPPEIVEYQVRKIDRLLREELDCPRGFADEKVVVLDPCCGTGAYLIEVLRCIASQLKSEGIGAMLGASLLEAFTRRVIGFEILTAPFVVSQLQLYLILAELGAEPKDGERLAIFLTNALTGWKGIEQMKLHFPELQEEHDAAERIKKDAKIIVILGNPPYNRFAGVPLEEEADLVDHYKGITRNAKGKQIGKSELFTRWRVRKHLLDDLYIRFFRLAEKRIGECAEYGVVSFITNSSYLVGRSHPIMRESLLKHFDKLFIDNLHGNRLANERTPDGESCETIFNIEGGGPGIKVGTAISTFIKQRGQRRHLSEVFVREFWSRAAKKRRALLDSLEMHRWSKSKCAEAAKHPEGPRAYEEFVPTEESKWKLVRRAAQGGYEDWPSLDELFPVTIQGVNPNRGLQGSIVEMKREVLERRMRDYFSNLSYEEFAQRHPGMCAAFARYKPRLVREKLQRLSTFNRAHILRYLVFPLDVRWIYYETDAKLLNERRPELWNNLRDNEFLVGVPQPRRYSETRPILVTSLYDLHLHDRGSVGFPAEIQQNQEDDDLFTKRQDGRCANLRAEAWELFKPIWNPGLDAHSAAARHFVRSLFRVVLAICHSPMYERDHKDSLAQDWAHVPIPKDKRLLAQLVRAGGDIATLLNPMANADAPVRAILGDKAHTLAVMNRSGGGNVRREELTITFSYYGAATGKWSPRAPSDGEPQDAAWGVGTGDLYINQEVYFANVPEKVWRFELGGYPVLKKWLGYRDSKRRDNEPLTLAEANEFRSIVQRVAALLARHTLLDSLYEQAIEDCFLAEGLKLR